jgi:hypothetical protein
MKNFVNLLPEEYRRQRLLRRRLLQWTLVWSTVVAGAMPLWGLRSQQLATEQLELRHRQSAYAPTKRMLGEIPRMQNEMRELSQRDEMVRQLGDAHPMLSALGMISQAAASAKGGVRVFQLIADRPPTATIVSDDKTQPSDPKPSLITIQGTSADNSAVARFVANLRQTQAFRRVDLKSSVRGRLAISDVQRFVVECEY